MYYYNKGRGGGGGGSTRCTITEASRLVLFLLCNSFFLLKSAHFRCTVGNGKYVLYFFIMLYFCHLIFRAGR